jgi:hypothetical protein
MTGIYETTVQRQMNGMLDTMNKYKRRQKAAIKELTMIRSMTPDNEAWVDAVLKKLDPDGDRVKS